MKSVLNEAQIERIADTVNGSNIVSAELKEDLIDHLCCIVEDEMSKGKEFETAYRTALQGFRPNGLDEIRNGTVFLFTSKNRKRIDRTIYTSGFLALTGILATVIMKILHVPYAQLVLLTTVCVVVLVFLPAFLIRKMKQTPGKKRIPFFGSKGVLLKTGALLCIVSAIFKICHWPFANYILLLACIFGYFGVFPLFFFKIFKKTR